MSALTVEPIRYEALVHDDRIHASLYTDPRIFAEEMEKIFYRGWVSSVMTAKSHTLATSSLATSGPNQSSWCGEKITACRCSLIVALIEARPSVQRRPRATRSS